MFSYQRRYSDAFSGFPRAPPVFDACVPFKAGIQYSVTNINSKGVRFRNSEMRRMTSIEVKKTAQQVSVKFTIIMLRLSIYLILLTLFYGMYFAWLYVLHILELRMATVRYILAIFLLVYSQQSLALFMPGGVQITSEITVASNDGGCWTRFSMYLIWS